MMTDDATMRRFRRDRLRMLKAATVAATLRYDRTWNGGEIARQHREQLRLVGADRARTIVLCAVHKARLSLTDGSITEAEQSESRAWLVAHGFNARGL